MSEPHTSGPAIEVQAVHKRFRRLKGWRELLRHPFGESRYTEALRGISFDLGAGTALGLLGPNGAGKSTLLKVLAGLVEADQGNVRLHGLDVPRQLGRARELLGFALCEERSFYWRLSGRQNLNFFASLHDLYGAERSTRVDEVLTRVGMSEHADRPFRDLSVGMKQRLALARGLLNRPRILLVDEPTRSLDPGAAAAMRRHLREDLVQGAGVTMILATHDLTEAREVSDRILLLDEGKVAGLGTFDEVESEVEAVFAVERAEAGL